MKRKIIEAQKRMKAFLDALKSFSQKRNVRRKLPTWENRFAGNVCEMVNNRRHSNAESSVLFALRHETGAEWDVTHSFLYDLRFVVCDWRAVELCHLSLISDIRSRELTASWWLRHSSAVLKLQLLANDNEIFSNGIRLTFKLVSGQFNAYYCPVFSPRLFNETNHIS